jgi:hypothetical protein
MFDSGVQSRLIAYLEDHKAFSPFSPTYYRFIRRVFQHPKMNGDQRIILLKNLNAIDVVDSLV